MMDEDGNPPHGILYMLNAPEDVSDTVRNDYEFEMLVCDLYQDGLCVLPRTRWIN